jgi:hypothetical protein
VIVYAYPIVTGALCLLALGLYFGGPWLMRKSEAMRRELDQIREASQSGRLPPGEA